MSNRYSILPLFRWTAKTDAGWTQSVLEHRVNEPWKHAPIIRTRPELANQNRWTLERSGYMIWDHEMKMVAACRSYRAQPYFDLTLDQAKRALRGLVRKPNRIKRVEQTDKFNSASQKARELRETNDCAVRAVTVATGADYELIHKLMIDCGRKPRKGTPTYVTHRVMNELGYDMRPISPFAFISRYPGAGKKLQNVTSHHMRRYPSVWKDGKTYLLRSRGHIWCVVDGENHDWSINNALRVIEIYEVTKRS